MDYRRPRLSQHIRVQLAIAVWMLSTAILQTLLLPTIFGAMLNVILVATVCWTLIDNVTKGAFVGFYGGLGLGLLSQVALGVHSLALLVVAGSTAAIAQRYPSDNWVVPLMMVAIATPPYQLLIQIASNGTHDWLSWVIVVLIPALIINLVITLPIFLLLRWWAERRRVRR